MKKISSDTLFTIISGSLLLIFGVLNFFMNSPIDLQLKPFHATLHVVLGISALCLPRYRRICIYSVTIVGLLFSIIGFAGVSNVPGLITLNAPLNYAYAIVGIIGLLVVVSPAPQTTKTERPVIVQ